MVTAFISDQLKMKEDGVMDQEIQFQPKQYVGHILTEFMNRNPDLTTSELGRRLGFTQSMISKIRTNKAPIRFDDLPRLFESTEGLISAGEFEIAILNIFTNGFVPPLPNYNKLSTDPVALSDRVVLEMNQSIQALSAAFNDFSDPSSPNCVADLPNPTKAYFQLYDVSRYTDVLRARIADYYHLPEIDLNHEREKQIEESNEHQI